MLTDCRVCVQIAGLVASLVVLLVVVAIGFVFEPLPQVGEAADLFSPQSAEQRNVLTALSSVTCRVLCCRRCWLPSSWWTWWACSDSSETFALCGGPVRLNWSVCHFTVACFSLDVQRQRWCVLGNVLVESFRFSFQLHSAPWKPLSSDPM